MITILVCPVISPSSDSDDKESESDSDSGYEDASVWSGRYTRSIGKELVHKVCQDHGRQYAKQTKVLSLSCWKKDKTYQMYLETKEDIPCKKQALGTLSSEVCEIWILQMLSY